MESQPQNPEVSNNPETFIHACNKFSSYSLQRAKTKALIRLHRLICTFVVPMQLKTRVHMSSFKPVSSFTEPS